MDHARAVSASARPRFHGRRHVDGFRDARILKDSIWRNEDGELLIHIDLYEGVQYHFRNIKITKLNFKSLGQTSTLLHCGSPTANTLQRNQTIL